MTTRYSKDYNTYGTVTYNVCWQCTPTVAEIIEAAEKEFSRIPLELLEIQIENRVNPPAIYLMRKN